MCKTLAGSGFLVRGRNEEDGRFRGVRVLPKLPPLVQFFHGEK